jgi:hypothetical protein
MTTSSRRSAALATLVALLSPFSILHGQSVQTTAFSGLVDAASSTPVWFTQDTPAGTPFSISFSYHTEIAPDTVGAGFADYFDPNGHATLAIGPSASSASDLLNGVSISIFDNFNDPTLGLTLDEVLFFASSNDGATSFLGALFAPVDTFNGTLLSGLSNLRLGAESLTLPQVGNQSFLAATYSPTEPTYTLWSSVNTASAVPESSALPAELGSIALAFAVLARRRRTQRNAQN